MSKENYRISNARKVNSKKNPDGYLYVLKLKDFDLYKIGVSQNPKRRIRDIKSYFPFDSNLLYLKEFIDVYDFEEAIHFVYNENLLRKEWFYLDKEEAKDLISSLQYDYFKENDLLISDVSA